jgi:hypothetical protein
VSDGLATNGDVEEETSSEKMRVAGTAAPQATVMVLLLGSLPLKKSRRLDDTEDTGGCTNGDDLEDVNNPRRTPKRESISMKVWARVRFARSQAVRRRWRGQRLKERSTEKELITRLRKKLQGHFSYPCA